MLLIYLIHFIITFKISQFEYFKKLINYNNFQRKWVETGAN